MWKWCPILGASALLHLAAEIDDLSGPGLILGRGFSVGYEMPFSEF